MKLKVHFMKLVLSVAVPAIKVVAILLLFLLSNTAFCAEYSPSNLAQKKINITIKKMFGSDIELRAFKDSPNCFYVLKYDSLIGYYCVGNAPSKYDKFEFMVVYDIKLNIQKVEVLVYREDYGFEIKNKRWLRQFITRKTDSVQAISGATISVNSLKKSVELLNQKMARAIH